MHKHMPQKMVQSKGSKEDILLGSAMLVLTTNSIHLQVQLSATPQAEYFQECDTLEHY